MAKRILIIDDERDMQIYLVTLFKKAGYETAVAENGEQGLQMVEEFKPDLITLDLLMPKKSGMTAYEVLRSRPETREIPVVVVTGLAENEDLFAGQSAGVPPPDAVLDKPIDRESFLKTVEELIR